MNVRSAFPALFASALLALAAPAHAVTCLNSIPAVNPDGHYYEENPPNGTVTHIPTGLMWKKCSEGQTWVANTCSALSEATGHSWADALGIAEASIFAGHTDWRLPNINELLSLVETCRGFHPDPDLSLTPMINDVLFPNTPSLNGYWSGSPTFNDSQAWVVNFGTGNTATITGSREPLGLPIYRVRLVRGGQSFATFDSRLQYAPNALGNFAAATATAGVLTSSADSKTLAGLTTVTGIKVEGHGAPQYRVNSGDWTSTPGVVKNGDVIDVRLTAGSAGSTRTATLTVGGVTANFVVSVAPHVVTPSAGTGGSLSPSDPQNVAQGDTISFTVTPSLGYSIDTVSGCGDGGELVGNTFTTAAITGNCTVTATFIPNYPVTPVVSFGSGSLNPSGQQSVNHGSTIAFTVTPAIGYSIGAVGGCSGELVGNIFTTGPVTAACGVFASFTLNSYIVTSSAGDGGSIDPDGQQSVNQGGTTVFTVTPDTGYGIGTVGGTCGGTRDGNTFTTNLILAPCTVTASFTLNSYTVTPSVEGDGGSIAPGVPQQVNYNQNTSFTLNPESGYEIDEVAGCGGTLDGSTFTTGAITAACEVSASFKLSLADGDCGEAEGVARLLPPDEGELCTAGTPEWIGSASGEHLWSCVGIAGGADAQCRAPGANAGETGGDGHVTMALLDGDEGCTVESAELDTPPAGLPDGTSLPFGVLNFVLIGCGDSATVQVSYDGPVDGMVYWKHIGDGWTTMPATLSGNTATFTIEDNGPFDADDAVDRIADPGGPGFTPTASGAPTAIPTLSQWMLAALSLALVLIAARLRKR